MPSRRSVILESSTKGAYGHGNAIFTGRQLTNIIFMVDSAAIVTPLSMFSDTSGRLPSRKSVLLERFSWNYEHGKAAL